MEYKSCFELGLYTFYYAFCKFVYFDVFFKADSYNIAVRYNDHHRHCVIAYRIILILNLFRNGIVKDYECLTVIAFNTGGFFLIECRTDKITVDVQFLLKRGNLSFCGCNVRFPASGLHCVNLIICVINCLVIFKHNVPLFCTGSRYATTAVLYYFSVIRFPLGSAVIVFHLF